MIMFGILGGIDQSNRAALGCGDQILHASPLFRSA